MVLLCLCCDFDGHQSRRRSCTKDNKRWQNLELERRINTLNIVVVHVWLLITNFMFRVLGS
jgi:hypothetical protein